MQPWEATAEHCDRWHGGDRPARAAAEAVDAVVCVWWLHLTVDTPAGNVLDAIEDLVEPDDLRAALDLDPAARAAWDAFPRSTKRAILEWITAAKRPTTPRRPVAKTTAEDAQGRRANQWRQPGQGARG